MAASMDQLIASLDAHCDVAANPFDTNRPHPRFSEYSSLREPSSLMGDQNKRRTEFLQRQKSKREKVINLQRRLIQDPEAVDDDNTSSPVKVSSNNSNRGTKYSTATQPKWTFAHQLMLSEWFVDVPPDLRENWLVKPCPKGRRMMVIAHQGLTKAYSKAGHYVASFSSALPSGSTSARQGITVLDCIWNWDNRTYYVLDILAWNNTVLVDCETEFRFYWLKTKLEENPETRGHSEKNRFAFVAVPSTECTGEQLTELMSHYPMFSEDKDPGLDGMLFYHKSNLYEHGTTPLVTWMKPFMMEEVLGIKVHQRYIEEKPASYCDQAAYIKEFEQASEARKASWGGGRGRIRRRAKHARDDNKMDCTDNSSKADEALEQ